MSRNRLQNTPVRERLIAARFGSVNTALFLLLFFVLVSLSTLVLAVIIGDAARRYAGFYSAQTAARLNLYIARNLSLVREASRSNDVAGWLADEQNNEMKSATFGALYNYAGTLDDAIMYIGVDSSLNKYTADGGALSGSFVRSGVIDPALPCDAWYFRCVQSDNDFELSIGVDEAVGVRRLWITHKVSDNGEVFGALRICLPFGKVFEDSFGRYGARNIRGFIIDKSCVVQMDSIAISGADGDDETGRDIRLFGGRGALSGAIDAYLSETPQPETHVTGVSSGDYNFVSLTPITDTDWSIVTLSSPGTLFSVAPLLIPLLAFALYAVISGLLMRRNIISLLNKLTGSVSEADASGGDIYGCDRGDELGRLARTIRDMRGRLSTCNTELQISSTERNRQERLLEAVNGAATILLSSDEKTFERSLRDGMSLMARCIGVDRILIWRNEPREGGVYYSCHFWWSGDGKQGESELAQMGYSYISTLPDWEERLSGGECVNGPLSALSDATRAVLEPYGIISILVVPVHLQGQFWGFISFDDCHGERFFSDDEVGILRSGSLMLASALNRAEADARMREADERAKLMLEATPLCSTLWDKDFQIIDCNDEAVKLFGLRDRQEFMDRFPELSPKFQPGGGLSSDLIRSRIDKAFRDGRHIFEWMHQMPDGHPVPAEVTLVRVRRADGYIVAGYLRDLREYNRIMAEIRHKDMLLRAVYNVASILLQSEFDEFEDSLRRCMGLLAGSIGADSLYVWQNHKKDGSLHATLLTRWPERIANLKFNSISGFRYDEVMPDWERILSSGQCVNGPSGAMPETEQQILKKLGSKSVLIVPVFLRSEFWGCVAFGDQHRERRFTPDEESILRSGSLQISNSLLRNETTRNMLSAVSKMEAVISNYSGIIWSVDRNNKITLFNGLYLDKLGLKQDLTEGKNINDVLDGSLYPNLETNVNKTIADGPQDWMSEIDNRVFHNHTTPIRDETGAITGVVGSIDDITDFVRLQQDLELALEEARAASRAKSDFLSNMSHEMRTPMNAIIGMTLIGKASNDLKRKDYAFSRIEDASNHLLGVINDILDMSKIEARRFDLSEVEFNFEKLLQKLVGVISLRVDEKRQKLRVNLDENIPQTLIGDDQRLAQVVANLLSNAVKFTPDFGTIRLRTRLLGDIDGACLILIDVTDTGIGISAEQRSRLFHSFEQAESSTSRKYGGTGLGLAISKHIVELMGGEIWVESEPGAGSTFSFTVRLKRGKTPGCKLTSMNWGAIRLLAVDDELETREYFQSVSSRLGVACDVAPGGTEALRMIDKNGPYDIYFLDRFMPGMDGAELARKIRAKNGEKPVIIMISAAAIHEVSESEDVKGIGIDRFLQKPLFPSSIADNIISSMNVSEMTGEESIAEDIEKLEGHCVLLAEDVDINREIVLALLEPTGLSIDCASNGVDALRMFMDAPDKYEMIFMDVQMPEMDGLEATRNIRALNFQKAKTIPIIAMTANVFKEDIEECLEVGMNDHIGKPLDLESVLERLRKYLK